MPRKYTKITPQIVNKVKKYLEDERGFSKAEIARLVGISDNSMKKIVRGEYDRPVEKPKATQQIDSEIQDNPDPVHITEIPFDRLQHYMRCEMFVEELFSIAVLSDKEECTLYFPRRLINSACSRYFPEKHAQTLDNLLNDTYA